MQQKTVQKMISFLYFKSMHKRFSVQQQRERNSKQLGQNLSKREYNVYFRKAAVSHLCWHQKQTKYYRQRFIQ